MNSNKENASLLQQNPLSEYYYGLTNDGKSIFRHIVIQKLGITQDTLYRWLRGQTKPRKIEAEALAEIASIDAAELYPCYYRLNQSLINI